MAHWELWLSSASPEEIEELYSRVKEAGGVHASNNTAWLHDRLLSIIAVGYELS